MGFSNFGLYLLTIYIGKFKNQVLYILQPPVLSGKADDTAEVHFVSFLSGGFNTAIVVNPPERKLAKHTSLLVVNYNQKVIGRSLCHCIASRGTLPTRLSHCSNSSLVD